MSQKAQIKKDFFFKKRNPVTAAGGSVVKNPPANAGDIGSIPGPGRSSGGEYGDPLQYSCQENPMDRGIWWATVMVSQRVRHD